MASEVFDLKPTKSEGRVVVSTGLQRGMVHSTPSPEGAHYRSPGQRPGFEAGAGDCTPQALKGRTNGLEANRRAPARDNAFFGRPFRACRGQRPRYPWALPRAGFGRPFRATNNGPRTKDKGRLL